MTPQIASKRRPSGGLIELVSTEMAARQDPIAEAATSSRYCCVEVIAPAATEALQGLFESRLAAVTSGLTWNPQGRPLFVDL